MPHPEELHLQLLVPRRLLRPIRRLVSAATTALAATRRSATAAGAAVAAAIRSEVLAGFRLLPAVVGRQGSVTARAVVPATAAAAKIRLNVHVLQNDRLDLAQFCESQCCGSGSGAFLTHVSGMRKKSRSGSGMNIPDYISGSLETITIFGVENTFFGADPGSF